MPKSKDDGNYNHYSTYADCKSIFFYSNNYRSYDLLIYVDIPNFIDIFIGNTQLVIVHIIYTINHFKKILPRNSITVLLVFYNNYLDDIHLIDVVILFSYHCL